MPGDVLIGIAQLAIVIAGFSVISATFLPAAALGPPASGSGCG